MLENIELNNGFQSHSESLKQTLETLRNEFSDVQNSPMLSI
jgi:hypothetical protein